MSNRVTFTFPGLDALKRALRNLPDELTDEGGSIAEREAEAAAERARANYAERRVTGDLAGSVKVTRETRGRHGVAVRVRVTAKHAHFFEYGTAARHTAQGWNRGVMPPAPPMLQFVPTIERARREMYDGLRGLLERHGLDVTG